jgi:hypothetical protein
MHPHQKKAQDHLQDSVVFCFAKIGQPDIPFESQMTETIFMGKKFDFEYQGVLE